MAGFYPAIAKRWVNQATVSREALNRLPIVPFERKKQLTFVKAYRAFAAYIDYSRTTAEHQKRLFAYLLHRAFDGALTASWREAHMKELLHEIEQQAKLIAEVTS